MKEALHNLPARWRRKGSAEEREFLGLRWNLTSALHIENGESNAIGMLPSV